MIEVVELVDEFRPVLPIGDEGEVAFLLWLTDERLDRELFNVQRGRHSVAQRKKLSGPTQSGPLERRVRFHLPEFKWEPSI